MTKNSIDTMTDDSNYLTEADKKALEKLPGKMVAQIHKLKTENERLKRDITILRWNLFYDGRLLISRPEGEWSLPTSAGQVAAARALERDGHLEKHPTKGWWRLSGGPIEQHGDDE